MSYEDHVHDEGNRRMRLDSGEVDDDRALVNFFYLLGRDHLPLGVVEDIMIRVEGKEGDDTMFTNGWLATWAQDVAERLA